MIRLDTMDEQRWAIYTGPDGADAGLVDGFDALDGLDRRFTAIDGGVFDGVGGGDGGGGRGG